MLARLPVAVAAALVIMVVWVYPAFADDPQFFLTHDFGTGTDYTWSLALGDMDGDGDLDIVSGGGLDLVSNTGTQSAVYLNDGQGNFATVRNFGTGSDITASVAVGDMDGDGDLDVVTGNYGQQNVVYLNDGAANFATSRTLRHRLRPDRERSCW